MGISTSYTHESGPSRFIHLEVETIIPLWMGSHRGYIFQFHFIYLGVNHWLVWSQLV